MVTAVTQLDTPLDTRLDAGLDARFVDRRLDLDLEAVDREFRTHADPSRMVQWLVDLFPVDQIVLASAMAAPVLVDVVSKVAPGVEVVFLDTGYHFDETLAHGRRRRRALPDPPDGHPRSAHR